MIQLFRVRGIPVRIDYGWLLIFGLISWSLASGYFPRIMPERSSAAYWLHGLGAAVLLFASVFLHELSHALVALRQGVRVGGITLHVFGGVSELESEPETPRAEFLIAVVGPLTSFAIAAACWAAAHALPTGPWGAAVLRYLGVVNLVVGGFNLVPGFPLDGGRILRAALWGWRGRLGAATRWASRTGSMFAALLIAVGVMRTVSGELLGGLWLMMIGLFLHQAAQSSYTVARMRARLEPLRVAEIMTPAPELDQRAREMNGAQAPAPVAPAGSDGVVAPGDSAWTAFMKLAHSAAGRVVVVDDGHVVGIVSHRDLRNVLTADERAAGRDARRAA